MDGIIGIEVVAVSAGLKCRWLIVYAVFCCVFLCRCACLSDETFGFVAVRTGPHLCDASLTSFCGLPLLNRNLDSAGMLIVLNDF